ncbi:MAG: hypothetical protein ACP5HG_04865 [Anaerolineae bacterium]
MKKLSVLVSGVLAAVLMATLVTGAVLARGPNGQDEAGMGPGRASAPTARGLADPDGDGIPNWDGTRMGNAFGFVDEDGDGVNDRYAQGDGVPDYEGNRMGYAYGFVDENGDGGNDRYAQGDGVPDCDGTCTGYGYGFVDEDGDGVNDRYADGECTPLGGEAMGQRRGRWSR